ncbi:MAG: PQQ-binding-like beta-propeller repeat protein [Planctomycetes bacterium]|nr:PQQ-binding-like beta-propeller repeat protein [Planctomycetota bacterium]
MRRYAAVSICLVLLGLTVSGQFMRQRIDPKADPNAFKITTQANLDEAMTRIARLKAQLPQAKDADERKFILTSVLELCQEQLNEDRNESGVIVVEKTDLIFNDVPSENVYDLPIRWQGAFYAIEDEIRALGKEGLDLYEEIYGPRASLLLTQAAQTQQRERIQYLNRRFGLTKAGLRAGILLASMYWEEGQTSQAARSLERVLSINELLSPDERARHSAWLAHCYRDLGERANLVKLIEQTVDLRERSVEVGSQSVKLGELLDQQLLEARDATTDTIDNLGVEWVGGNYTNTGLHERPSDFSNTAWATGLPPLEANATWNKFMNYPAPVVPPYLPIFDGDMFYVNTGDQLIGYDLTGPIKKGTERKETPSITCRPFNVYSSNWRTREPDPGMILPVSMYRGTVFTAIENPLSTTYHDPNPDRNFRLWSHYPKTRRALCAIDGNTGRLLWKIGGQYEGSKDETTNFLSAIVHDGTLYAIASRVRGQAEVFLYALNPDSGEVLWNLRLCYGQQETTMFGRPAREPHPSLPAIAAGRLYLCTNIGGVVSVDLATRSLSWISRYEYMPRPITKYTETYYRDVTWYNSPTIYTEHNGKPYILVAPTDADKMFALDARTGKLLWRLAQDLSPIYGGRSLVGVRDGKAYVAADGGIMGGAASRLHTVDIGTGRVTNSLKVTPAKEGTLLKLAGRPSIADNLLLWPGELNRGGCTIAAIDLDKMRVVESVSAPASWRGYGFSVFAQHGVVFTATGNDYSDSNSVFSARFDSRSLLEAAKADYQAHPDNADAAVRYGLLMLRMGDRADAMKAIKHAFEIASTPPPDTRVRDQAGRALVNGYLELADKALTARKYAEVRSYVQSAREYAVGRSQLSECFVREESALLAESQGSDLEAFYRRTITDDPDFGMGQDPEIPVGLYCRIRLAERLANSSREPEAMQWYQDVQEAPDRYVWNGRTLRALAIERMREIIKRKGREAYAAQENRADAIMQEGTPEAMRKCLRLYPLSDASDKAALELANNLLVAHLSKDAAELLQLALEENPDRARAPELQALLALCFADSGERLRARLLASRLLREHAEGKLVVGGETRAFKDILKPLSEGGAAESAAQTLPHLPSQMSELWQRKWDVGGFARLPAQPTVAPNPRFYLGERNRLTNELIAVNAVDGTSDWAQDVAVSVTDLYRTSRGTLFVQGQGFSLYDDNGTELWSSPSGGTPDPVNLQGGMLAFATRYFHRGSELYMVRISALDADSGGLLWESSIQANSARWLQQTPAGVLVMTIADETALTLLDTETGNVLKTRTLPAMGRVTVQPQVVDDRVMVIDRDGTIHAFDVSTLAPGAVYDTKVRFPTKFERVGDDLLVVGLTGAGRFSAKDATPVWRMNYEDNVVVTAQVVLEDSLVLATKTPGTAGRVMGYKLSDGKPTFTYEIKRQNESDRIDLQNAAAFKGGVVLAFSDNRITQGRMQLWGFRMLVLNNDGTERFTWEHEAGTSPLFMQLALIDNYIALTCDNTTFGFGHKD